MMFLYLKLKQGHLFWHFVKVHVVNLQLCCCNMSTVSSYWNLRVYSTSPHLGEIISVIFYSFLCHFIFHCLMCCSLKMRHKRAQTIHKELTEDENITRQNDTNGHSAFSLLLFQYLRQLHQSSNFTPPFPLNPHPSRTQTADESQGLSSHVPLSSPQPPPTTHKNSISTPNQDLDNTKPSDPWSSKTDQSSTVNSVTMTPKLARAGPKIFDTVRAFEERRASVDLPGGARSVSGLGRAASFDSDDSRKKTGGPSNEEGRILHGAAQKRAAFKQRASSLEDKTSYSQRVQSYQSKFAEELQRIKKLVGKPSLKKAYSTEQLSQKERLTPGKLEPIPPQVVKKLEARERALEERRVGEREGNSRLQISPQAQGRGLGNQSNNPGKDKMTQPDSQGKPVDSSSRGSTGKISVTMETAPVHQLPGQPLPTATRTNLTREKVHSSPAADKDTLVATSHKSSLSSRDLGTDSKRDTKMDNKADHRSPSPNGKRASPVIVREPGSQYPPKPPRLTPSPTPSISPLLKRRKAEVGRTSPALKVNIPTILVEDEPMETECDADRSNEESKTRRKEGRVHKSKRGRSAQPRSPEEGGSSDDSYLSADEEPAEGPRFERPLEDTTAPCGSEVTLKCIITGSPPPTVTWRKNNVEIRSDAFQVVKAEGERHSLAIKQMRLNNAGSYCVTAVNTAGRASCSAMLYIQSEPTHMQCGKPADSLEVSSPIQSDEEYLSPQEEAMELGDSPALSKSVHFKEPPSFQVAPCDQGITEGQDVVISAKVRGQPKPMVYWLKDRVTVKTAGRFAVRETDDGVSEMRISSAQRSDAGLYVCKVINEYGTKQAECRVEVIAAAAQAALKITREVKDVGVRAGESAMFECYIIGPPDMDVDWLSNGKLIQPALLNCKMHFDGKRCRLLLNSVHEDDSGTYTCKLSTAKEELTSSANLRVTPSKEPLFTRKLDILEVIEGRTARFDCKVSGSPAPRVTWMHFGKNLSVVFDILCVWFSRQLTAPNSSETMCCFFNHINILSETRVEESDNVRILQEGGRHSLVITHVSSDTEGFYTAVAQNIHGKAECTAELYMQEPRAAISSHMAKLEKMPSIPEEPELLESEVEKRTMPDFVKPLADVEVIEGKEAVLKCKVAGLPYPTIAWYHNGKRIESSEERKMTQYRDVHNLVIRSACHAHGGVYKAVISNKVGKAACYAHLYVTDIVPDPPDGPPVIEAITGKTITLSWKRPKRLDPSFDASSLLYVVQQQPLGSIQWSVVASSLKEPNYTVTSLSKGVRYAFRVLTSTGKTLSKPSPSTDLVQLLDRGPYLRKAPVILDKPDVVYVVENQPASITITLNHVHAVITWKRRGVVLVNRPGMYEMSMPDDDQHTLKLQRVKSTDIGQLVVTASNQFGSDLCTLQLAMAVPPKFETIMEDVDVHIGETSRLAVVVEGKPDPDILWYKDDVLLSESSHFTFVYDDPEYSLVVLNACPEHSGVYTCTAKNLAGSNSCKAELTVHTERKEVAEPMEDEGTILRKMRRLTDYYDIHKELGRGAFAYVKRVTQKKGKTEFAAKFISARGKRKAFALREMDLLSELDNERILYFHDAFEKKDVVVLITELCHEEFLERMARKTTVMELEIRCSVQQILEGLRYLHQKNIAHLDIKPENILMASPGSDQIRICDFGNAIKLEASEEYYCKYGTPEYVAPEIVNQTPVSTATDIWPVCVITYLCLTGVSPFAGENDRATALNIRNYNVAFEESMFSDLCKEAKGFVIKLLVVDRLRPSAIECLRHPWFKSQTNKSISTAMLKQVLSRRRWQRSLISYKAKMVMRSIPELLNDSSSHVSIAVARHLKEGSPQLSSSSDSDADVDELPFIPMPLSMVFSGSRVSLNEIPGDEDVSGWPSVAADGTRKNMEVTSTRGRASKRLKDEEDIPNGEKIEKTKRVPLKKGSSVESDESETKARRATMRRGSSADSALLLHIDPEEKNANEDSEASSKSLKKAVSMELPNRSPSPGAAKLSQEDYALKLELMRQRLLRGGSMDKKMSGLRGPLFETLGMEDERQTGSLDRNLRRSRAGPSTITRAASSESAGEDVPKTKVFCKSASFTQGDSEPMPLHRRFGAPLEIPSVGNGSMEGKKLQEATSMSALTEQTTLESTSSSPTERTSFILPTPGVDQQRKQNNVTEYEDIDGKTETRTKTQLDEADRVDSESRSPSVITPIIVIEEEDDEVEREENQELHINEKDVKEDENAPQNSKPSSAFIQPKDPSAAAKPSDAKGTDTPTLPEHPAVFAKVATADRSPGSVTSSNPDLPATPRQPVLRTDIKDIDSEEVFEARFKKRESSLTRGLRKLTRNKSEEKSPVLSRKAIEGGEEVYRPGPRGAPLEMVSKGLQEKSKSVQDLREEDKETGFGLIGRLSLRAKRSTSVDKKSEKSKEEKHQDVQEPAVSKRVSWAIGRSKSLDTKELNSAGAQRQLEEKEQRKAEESSVSAMRRKFESKVAGISAKIRTQSEERKDKDADGSQKELAQKDLKKVTDSPVLAMRQKFENKVAGISTKIRSQSEERKADEEGKRTPLFTRHRHSQSEGRGLKGMGIPENQLAKQTISGASKESVESTSSIHSEKASESDRRSRWDRWGLTRSKRDKTPSQSDLPASVPKEEGLSKGQQFIRSASDFAPVFHIKLKDHILLEGEPVTLSCLPAGSPHPEITWMKDRKPLQVDDRISLVSHPDGRQLLMIMKSTWRDAGIYECVAANPIATITTSCTLSIACVPKRPGTPEVPQTYSDTALVLWKPADTKSPCSYTLERKTEGDSNWLTVATGVVDCYYNVTNLPAGGTYRFRVCCVNKAGQGPYSNYSAPVHLDSTAEAVSPTVAVVKTIPTPPETVVTSSVTVPPLKPVQNSAPRITVSTITFTSTSPKDSASPAAFLPPTTSPTKMVVSPTSFLPSSPTTNPPSPSAGMTTEEAQKTGSSLSSSPTVKAPPPFVLPKPQSPVNVVTPMTQTPPISPPPPLVTPPPTPTKPAVASVPTYVPTTTVTARVAPTPVSFSPPVLQTSSLSPIGEGASTPTRGTPSGRATPSTTLRQGVPQKPYTFLDEKARGRFGVIRECRENGTGKIYMAKIIPYSQENKQEVLKEYEILKSLHNEKVMALHEAYVTPRYLVLVAEYCTGKELLYSLIDRFRYSEDDVVGYLVQILQGVEYLHSRRVLHLDLKADNIMVTNLNAIKIVDFGSAQSFNPLSLKHQDSGAGTLEYMAPEMVKGEVVGPPADIWTVGVVTYIMLSGRLPFEDKDPLQVESKILMAKFDPTKLYPNVSQSASAFLKKMLSSYPWARPTTRDCFTHAWLQDSYLMKLRRQTLTFTSSRLKEFLVEQQCRRTEGATKHKVLLRTYQSSPQSPASGTAPHVPSPK
uniref:non-specific serine/threonine protein kinase n=1 Tax=Lates calcarifer TaxID=8187 RepID=A0A4W6F4F6_LATCA